MLLAILPSIILVTIAGNLVSPELVLESGYSISTVMDFNKPLPSSSFHGSGIIPFSLHPLTRSPTLAYLLDSTNSIFYSIELPFSQESVVRVISGKRTAGFSDGDATSTMFDRPRSFAVDSNNNVYVADRINHAIRKISGYSGMTTTIAGGYSKKAGHADGPAQNATFSEDFDLLYLNKLCALVITDRGSRMIRHMDLKPEDCEVKHTSSKGLGAIPVSIIAAATLFSGFAFGFIARPFFSLTSNIVSRNLCTLRRHSWSLAPEASKKPPPMFFSGIKSAIASFKALNFLFSSLISLAHGYILLVFRYIFSSEPLLVKKESALSMEADFVSRNHALKLPKVTDEISDLITFEDEDDSNIISSDLRSFSADKYAEKDDFFSEKSFNGKIEYMMTANLMYFTAQSKQDCLVKKRR